MEPMVVMAARAAQASEVVEDDQSYPTTVLQGDELVFLYTT
jgi:hypothetical protein